MHSYILSQNSPTGPWQSCISLKIEKFPKEVGRFVYSHTDV